MKKRILIILLTILFIPFLNVKAVDSDDVNFKIKAYYAQSDIDIAGSLNVKELFVLDGTFNGFERAIIWKRDNLPKFTGKTSDFDISDIYNASRTVKYKVGIVDVGEKVEYNDLFNKVSYYKVSENPTIGSTGVYKLNESENDSQVRIFSETRNSIKAFYLEYTVPNVSVKHNDIAELYYPFISEDFRNNIENMEIRLFLPEPDKNYRIWAHGPLNGTIYKTKDNTGAVLKCTNLPSRTPVDMRVTYNKDYFPISINKVKISGVDGLNKILEVEKKKAEKANIQRKKAKIILLFINILVVLYCIGAIALWLYIYLKYDKEFKSKFKSKYYRQINNNYSPEIVEYIMKKRISSSAFNASLLNLINKKVVSVDKGEKKNEYIFKLNEKKKVTASEQKLIDLLFKYVGDGKEFNSKDLKKKARVNGATSNKFYDKYTDWKDEVLKEAENEEFYIDNSKPKIFGIVYAVLGFAIFFMAIMFDIPSLLVLFVLPFAIFILIYALCVTKKSEKGNEEFNKWKAFKRYLEDFGRFNEKELPEVKIWEQLLVYAAVFGIADKVSKSMKVQFDKMHPNYDYTSNTLYYPYYLGYGSFVSDIGSTVSSSLSIAQTANSTISSGSGGGGGFSGGSSFGGGGSFGGSGGF